MSALIAFELGALSALCAVAALFFLRFWRKTADRFFLLFSVAFFLIAINRLVMVASELSREPPVSIFLIRLTAHLLLLWAIIDKNRAEKR